MVYGREVGKKRENPINAASMEEQEGHPAEELWRR